MRMINAVPAVFMIGLSAMILLGTSDLPYWVETTPGARFFPVWLAGIGLFLSALFLVQVVRGTDPVVLEAPERASVVRVLLTVVGLVCLAIIVPHVGMVFGSAVFMSYLLLFVLRQRFLPSLLTVVVVAVGIELIFVRWLGVSLPGFALTL